MPRLAAVERARARALVFAFQRVFKLAFSIINAARLVDLQLKTRTRWLIAPRLRRRPPRRPIVSCD